MLPLLTTLATPVLAENADGNTVCGVDSTKYEAIQTFLSPDYMRELQTPTLKANADISVERYAAISGLEQELSGLRNERAQLNYASFDNTDNGIEVGESATNKVGEETAVAVEALSFSTQNLDTENLNRMVEIDRRVGELESEIADINGHFDVQLVEVPPEEQVVVQQKIINSNVENCQRLEARFAVLLQALGQPDLPEEDKYRLAEDVLATQEILQSAKALLENAIQQYQVLIEELPE